jgi:hypothetical protein
MAYCYLLVLFRDMQKLFSFGISVRMIANNEGCGATDYKYEYTQYVSAFVWSLETGTSVL